MAILDQANLTIESDLTYVTNVNNEISAADVRSLNVNWISSSVLIPMTSSMSVASAVNATSSSYALSASYSVSASYAANVPATASYALQALSSSYAVSASYASNVPATASFAISSSYASTASVAVKIADDLVFNVNSLGILWQMNSDAASIRFYNLGNEDPDSRLEFNTNDDNNEYYRWTHTPTGGTLYESMRLTPYGANNAILSVSGSIIANSYTGSLLGTASFAISSSHAISSSVSATSSYALTASYAQNAVIFPYTGSATFSGSLVLTGSFSNAVSAVSVASSTASVDLSRSNFFTVTLPDAVNTLIRVINPRPGQTANIVVTTGINCSASFSSNVKQPSGSFYTPTPDPATDVLSLICVNTSDVLLVKSKMFI